MWDRLVDALSHPRHNVRIGMVGKYVDLTESYKSLTEALVHAGIHRSEEHTSELQSLMRISYAVFCLKKKKTDIHRNKENNEQTKNNSRTTTDNKTKTKPATYESKSLRIQ